MKTLRLIFCIILVSLFVVSQIPIKSYASGGIPIVVSTQSVGSLPNQYPTLYYPTTYEFPISQNAPYYIYGNLQIQGSRSISSATWTLQGWDGANWNDLYTFTNTSSFMTPNIWIGIPSYKIRAIGRYVTSGYQGGIIDISGVTFTFSIYQFGADQATAQTAADAAIQARDAANNTVTYAQQASQNASFPV
ncbi:hypothetical protein [Aneurinibacillus terranovensis]|uniref:hypothetical protein n=1 Tax=Aneurinibacillus terranovensis TaxID=278991 RepID=UPI000484D317|nr:hypothetical protein [Aneurinibacillus terranovensis]